VLDKIGIPVKLEVPGVGQNVQEHVIVAMSFELKDDAELETLDILRDPTAEAKQVELHASGTGLLTMGIVGFTFTSFDTVTPDFNAFNAKIKDEITKKMKTCSPGLQDQYRIQLDRLDRGAPGCEIVTYPGFFSGFSGPNPPVPDKKYVTIMVAMNHMFSRGTIHSTSSNPLKDPEFDPHYFEDQADLDIFTESIKFGRSLASVSPLKDLIVKELNPGPTVQSDKQIQDWMTTMFSTTYHTCGSCSMLPRDKGGVVDPELKVYGTNNVRVVDLSIVPLHFASHSQATVYAIAERAAEIIQGK